MSFGSGSSSNSLSGAQDVALNNPANGEVLQFNASVAKWRNAAISGLVSSVAGKTGAVTLTSSDIADLTTTIRSALRTSDAVVSWDGSGSQPLRTTATTDTLRPVIWRQPTPPPTTTGYAIVNLDIWDRTPSP